MSTRTHINLTSSHPHQGCQIGSDFPNWSDLTISQSHNLARRSQGCQIGWGNLAQSGNPLFDCSQGCQIGRGNLAQSGNPLFDCSAAARGARLGQISPPNLATLSLAAARVARLGGEIRPNLATPSPTQSTQKPGAASTQSSYC